MVLLFDLPVMLGLQRAGKRAGDADRFEAETLQFFDRVRNAYRELASKQPGRFLVIHASASPEAVRDDVRRAVGVLL